MSENLAERFVDAAVTDGYLARPAELLNSMRFPPGRRPSETSKAVAAALEKINDDHALTLVSSILDAAYFSVFNLIDASFEDVGLRFELVRGSDREELDGEKSLLHEIYRDRVDPNGILRPLS